MGANAQTSVPAFSVGQVLTAQQQTEINTGTPVFAGTAQRDAAFGGAGEKTLAEGQLAYIEALDVVQMYDGANWITVGPTAAPGLELITSQTIDSAVNTVTVSNVFSATYDNYRIVISGGVASTGVFLLMQLGAVTTGYYWGQALTAYGGGGVTQNGNNTSSWRVGYGNTDSLKAAFDVIAPNLTKRTIYSGLFVADETDASAGGMGGYNTSTTAHTAFTISLSSGTITGGTIKVYGYKN